MLKIIVLGLLLGLSFSAAGTNWEELVEEAKEKGAADFFQQFPYDKYLESYSVQEVNSLEKHRSYLNSKGIDGTQFISSVLEHHLKKQKIDFARPASLKSLFQLGEQLSYATVYGGDSMIVYAVFSDFIFEKIANALSTAIEAGTVDLSDWEITYYIQRLLDYKFAIDVPVSNWTKLLKYIGEGRWDYLLHKATSTYKQEFMLGVGGMLLVLLGLSWILLRYRKNRKTK
ncbi:MAG: hypothetical protein AB8G15_05380 [Saprospiraceae bacterium]